MLEAAALQKLPKSLLRRLLTTSGVLLGDLHAEKIQWENGRTVTREIQEQDPEYDRWHAVKVKCQREAEWQRRIRAALEERRPAISLIGLDSFLDEDDPEGIFYACFPVQTANESLLEWGVSKYNRLFGVMAFEQVFDDAR